MASCRTFLRDSYCSSYFNFKGEPTKVAGCQNDHGESNTGPSGYMRWPDANYTPLPVP